MTDPVDNRKPHRSDAEDANATVPVKGWNDAATIPLARPAPGSAVNLDQTVKADLNRPQVESDTVPTVPTPAFGSEATLVASTHGGHGEDHAVLVSTRPTRALSGSETPMSSSALSQSGGQLSRSFTRTGRTRVNLNLPAEAQQLDQKLQMSRASVLSDMATARIPRGELPPGIIKLIEQQGTEGRYAIDRPIAAGGMGAVLQIADHDFRRPAAMKVILSKYTANPEATERFLAEAQVTAQLEHPNIVPIHDLGVMEDGTLYFTMKLIEGMSLGRVVKLLQQQAGTLKDKEGQVVPPDADSAAAAARWTVEEKLLTFLKVLDGVGFAHSRGVIHRDIKPDNVMLGSHGEVLVVDWGIAKVLGNADASSELVRQVASVRDQHSLSATLDGSAMGTLYYMPPEQALGNLSEVDARSDIYALGATLYELLALRRCLDAGNMADMVAQIAHGGWNRLDAVAPHLNPDLVAVVHRAMARERHQRHASCDEFAAELRRYLAGRAVLSRRRNLIERMGLWYAAHRRQVQVAAAGIALVVVAVMGTAWAVAAQSRARSAALLLEARSDYERGRPEYDAAVLDQARLKLVEAEALRPGAREVAELRILVDLALEHARSEEKARLERQAAAERARQLLADGERLKAAGDLQQAEKVLDAALKLAPGDEHITAALKRVVALRSDERAAKARTLAMSERRRGDALLAQAEALERADARVDALLRQAEDAFAKAETEVPIEGTQEQVRRVALLRQAAEAARKAAADRTKGDAAAQRADEALGAGRFPEAKEAVAQALGFLPNRTDLVQLRDRILEQERQALADQAAAARLRRVETALSAARGALAGGDLVAARDLTAQAWGELPGHPATEVLRQQVAEGERQAVQAARLAEARAKAKAAMAEALVQRANLQAGVTRLGTAATTVSRLSQELSDRPPAEKGPLWQAHRDQQSATTAVSEHWSLAEASAQNVLGFLAEDASNPLVQEARTLLAELYQARLTDARRRRDVANVAAFANLLMRYDDGRYASLLKDLGRLSISGPAGLAITVREVEEGPDLRLVPRGEKLTVKLPAEPLSLRGGRYQLGLGEVVISVVVSATTPVEVVWPGTLPSIAGMPLRYVPALGGRKAFMLAEHEVTFAQYNTFLADPAVWSQVQAAWKEFYGTGDPRLMRLLPRSPSGESSWQTEAKDDQGLDLTRATMPPDLAPLPVWGIGRDDAEAYCAWLGRRSGLKVRLPTIAEWRSAADAGDDRRVFPWGEVFDPTFTISVYGPGGAARDMAEAPGSAPADVGPFGHRDLAGNLREWTADRSGKHGAWVAGGAWSDERPDHFRSTAIDSAQPVFTNPAIGFRILVELP
jgi:serine/threonine protein kinase